MKKLLLFCFILLCTICSFFAYSPSILYAYANVTQEEIFVHDYSMGFISALSNMQKDNWSDNYFSSITMTIGENNMQINNRVAPCEPITIEDDELVLPLVDLANVLGVNCDIDESGDLIVYYDQEIRTIPKHRTRRSHHSEKRSRAPDHIVENTLNVNIRRHQNQITITNDFQTKQLLVQMKGGAKIRDNFGAIQSVDEDGLYLLQYRTERQAIRAFELFGQEKNIQYVEPNKIMSHSSSQKSSSFLANRWGSEQIHADAFIQVLQNLNKNLTEEKLVSVIDTGLYTGHQMVTDRHRADLGFDLVKNSGNMTDVDGHGTHVSGTIIDCTPSNVKIVPFQVFEKKGNDLLASTLTVANAVNRARQAKVSVINLSLGSPGDDNTLRNNITAAVNAGIVVVAAAGNDGVAPANFPARYNNVIGVAAIDTNKKPVNFSNFGTGVDIAAPGVSIQSAYISHPGSYVLLSGTSMASPHVAAVAMLLRLYRPNDSVSSIRNLITENIHASQNWNPVYGAGISSLESLVDKYANEPVREPVPEVSIDFASETLKDFIIGAKYRIQSTEFTAASNTYPINAAWFNTNITITRLSRNHETYLDSDSQSLAIPSKPAAPTGLTTFDCTTELNNDGRILGVSSEMEYKHETWNNRLDVKASELINLSPGLYLIRIKETVHDQIISSFPGSEAIVRIEAFFQVSQEDNNTSDPETEIETEFETETELEAEPNSVNQSGSNSLTDDKSDILPVWIWIVTIAGVCIAITVSIMLIKKLSRL